MAAMNAIKVSTMTNDLAVMIQEGLDSKGLSLRDLAIKVGISYEYMRMIVRGDRVPQKVTLLSICRALDLDCDEALRLSRLQRMQATPEDVTAALPPRLRKIAELWVDLTDAQREYVLQVVTAYSAAAQHHKEEA